MVILHQGIMTGRRQSTWGAVCVLFFFNIYMASLGLNCSTWESMVFITAWRIVGACGIKFPDQVLNPDPIHWEHRVLATGPPGKSPGLFLEMDADYTSMCPVGENSLRTCTLSSVSIIFNTSFPLTSHTATTCWQIKDLNFKN